MLNRVFLYGNLVKDPELIYSKNGTAIVKFTAAHNNRYKDKNNVIFIDIVAFGRNAENINKFFKKGSPILIEGSLVQDRWEKDGKKYSKYRIQLEKFSFVNSGKAKNGTIQNKEENTAELQKPQESYYSDEDDEEIPF